MTGRLQGHETPMESTVYIETSIVSYLTARPSRDVVVAAYQEMAREWWRDAPDRFVLVVSELVVSEARSGDHEAAQENHDAYNERPDHL